MNFEYQITKHCRGLRRRHPQKVVRLDQWIEERAKLLERAKDYKGALVYWNRLLKVSLGHRDHQQADVAKLAAIHYRMGLAHRSLKDNRKSLHHLKYCVRLNSNEARYFDAYGRASLAGGHWAVASDQFQRAMRLDPSNALYVRRLAWIFLMMDKKEAALRLVDRAISLKSTCRESHFLRAKILMEMNEFLQAVEALKTIKADLRVKKALAFCRERMPCSVAGATLSIAKRGMTCEAKPFSLKDLRVAEDLWRRLCCHLSEKILSLHFPSSWAGALAWFVLNRRGGQEEISLSDLSLRFGATSEDIWPCLLRIQRTLHDFCTEH